MRVLVNALSSSRLAFFLIAVLLVHVLASAVVPQRGLTEDEVLDLVPRSGPVHETIELLRLDRIYTAPPFHALLALLVINLALGNVRRFRRVYRLERTLLRLRHLGSIVFHLALITILAGAIGNYLFKFQGVFALTEGQTASDQDGGYFRTFLGPMASPRPGGFRVTLEELDTYLDPDGLETGVATLEIVDAGGAAVDAAVSVGHPLVWQHLEFHLGSRLGFSPELVVTRADGSAVFRGFVRLAAAQHEGDDVHSDFIELPGQLTLRLEIHEPKSATPLRRVVAERAGMPVFEGYVSASDTIRVDEFMFSVPRMRRWAYVHVSENPGVGFVFAGFWIALAGLTMTFAARVRMGRRDRGSSA